MSIFKKTTGQKGFSVLEVIISAFITGLLVTAAFKFYGTMHSQSETQYNVSEMQQLCRTSLQDIRKSLLQAGFKLNSHEPYKISGDTLSVYFSLTQPVDTVKYYLVEFTTDEYDEIPDLPPSHQLYKLVKKVNSEDPNVFADYITSVSYNQLDSANIVVTLNVQSLRSDDSYAPNDGFRIYSISERVKVRNVG